MAIRPRCERAGLELRDADEDGARRHGRPQLQGLLQPARVERGLAPTAGEQRLRFGAEREALAARRVAERDDSDAVARQPKRSRAWVVYREGKLAVEIPDTINAVREVCREEDLGVRARAEGVRSEERRV